MVDGDSDDSHHQFHHSALYFVQNGPKSRGYPDGKDKNDRN